MALTYTTTKSTLDEIAREITQAGQRLSAAREQLAAAEATLSGLGDKYSGFVNDLDAEAAAQGTALWNAAKDEKDEMVADFNAMRTRATNLLAAYDSVS